MKTIVGERIKRRLAELGMNQATLARKCGRSPSLISKILKGERGGDGPTISAIAKALGTTAEWLTGQSRAAQQVSHGGGHGRTLREVIRFSKICASRFEEAEGLAKSIFSGGRGLFPLPYFTQHGEHHCKMVEKCLERIIWGGGESTIHYFVPTPEEAMFLLSAVWLHDIGMMYGIFENERPEDLVDLNKATLVRNEHEFRAASYIQDKWKENCGWSEDEKTWLSNICVYHRRRHPIGTFEPFKIKGRLSEGYVRLGILAALLRLADACDVGQFRCPWPLMVLYRSLGIHEDAVRYWAGAELIREVQFDHTVKRITLICHCPPRFVFGLGEFDLAEVGEMVCRDIQGELSHVQQMLLPYPNLAFLEVQLNVRYIRALEVQQDERYLALWPYLLNKPSSTTEAAAAFAQLLLFAVKAGEKTVDLEESWRDKINSMMKAAVKSRPFDFMIRNLGHEVDKILSRLPKDAKSAEELTSYLKGFLRKMEENLQKMTEFAQELVGPDDALIVYGYSSNIVKLLESVTGQHRKTLYIVEYYRPTEVHLRVNENEIITSLVDQLGFGEVKFISMAAVAHVLAELEQANVPCRVLLGTHGVLKNGDFLCKVGSYTVGSIAKGFDCAVTVFADKNKVLKNGESNKCVGEPETLLSQREYGLHPETSNIIRVAPKMDIVPRKLVDFVVTEEGVFSTKDWIPEKKVLKKTRESD